MKPEPIECSQCGRTYEFTWQDEEWFPDSEWWYTENEPFLCSKGCYLKAVDMVAIS